MSHHSDDPIMTEELRRIFRRLPEGLGATGEFPRGKITESDEGEIKLAIKADPETQTIIFHFGKPIVWIGFSVEQIDEIIAVLQDKKLNLRGIV